jgi:hypothetical protein
LVNLNLEGLVNFNYQEKLKRDRIGIIFEKAVSKAWDPYQKKYNKKAKNTDHFEQASTCEGGSSSVKKQVISDRFTGLPSS